MRKTSFTQRPRSYVVRIYRQSPNRLVGQVEDVQNGLIHPFRSAAELWHAVGGGMLAARAAISRPRARRAS
jgi:hypothetical protein